VLITVHDHILKRKELVLDSKWMATDEEVKDAVMDC
jgi:hypothetical protein